MHAANVTVATNAAGQASIAYPPGKFSATPQLALTAQFNENVGGAMHAHMGRVTVSNHTPAGFTVTVCAGAGTAYTGSVVVSYVAVGT